MTDDPASTASKTAPGPWLSPSEALTRFVPTLQGRRRGAGEVAPIRFAFRVGSLGLLVPMGMLGELVDNLQIYPVPTTPDWFHGLIDLRGGLVPVFNLTKLFGAEDQGRDKRKLLVLNTGADAVGVLIDGLPLTVDIRQRLPQFPPLPAILREYSEAAYAQEKDIWVEFDLDGFFRAVGSLIAA